MILSKIFQIVLQLNGLDSVSFHLILNLLYFNIAPINDLAYADAWSVYIVIRQLRTRRTTLNYRKNCCMVDKR